MSISRAVSILTAGLVAAALAPATAATAATPAAADPTTTYTVNSDVRITMSDGVRLDSDEYVPTGCPCPVILIQTPYRKQGGVAEANPYFPEHGYAEIVVEVRGTGGSEGYWDSFGPREQQDGAELVSWAQRRPFSNGVIGLAGASYSAINQLLTVEQAGTGAVKAIFPVVPMADSYRDVTYAGGNTDAGFIPFWLGLVNTLAVIPAQDTSTQPAIALNAESQHALDLARFTAPALASSSTGGDMAYDGPFYRVRSPITKLAQVKTPAFIVGGLWDLFQRGEPLLYRGLGLPDTEKKLLIGPWFHDDGATGQGLPATDRSGRTIPSLNDLQLQWFDHFLRGRDNGIDRFPNVEQFYQGVNAWIPQGGYPAPGTRYAPLYLAPGGGLAAAKPKTSGSATVPYTVFNGACSRSADQWTAGVSTQVFGTQGSPCDAENRQNEAQGTATFTTPPATTATAISGPIEATLYLSSTRPDATLIATLTDVAPDGSSNPMTAGSLIASQRALTTARCQAIVQDCSLYAGDRPSIPWHPFTKESQQPLTPGQVYEVELEIFPTSAALRPGHSLRLVLSSSDVPHETANLPNTLNQAGAATTYYFGPDRPSSLYVGSGSFE